MRNFLIALVLVALAFVFLQPWVFRQTRHYRYQRVSQQARIMQAEIDRLPEFAGVQVSIDDSLTDIVSIYSYENEMSAAKRVALERIFRRHFSNVRMQIDDSSARIMHPSPTP